MGIEQELPSDWKAQTIEECMSAIIDYRGKTPQKVSFGVPLITAKIVKGGRILDAEEFIAESDYVAWMRRGMPLPGDVVVTTEAPLGEVAQLDDRKIALAQRLIGLRGKPDRLDNTFLRFAMQAAIVQDQLASRASGTTVLGIRQAELRHVEIPLPPLPEQRAIARVLGGLDDKIELNRRMNRTLEDLARGLFRSWFVDFDPVTRAAAGGLGRPGSTPGPRPTRTPPPHTPPWPTRLVDSPIGPVPEGWRVGTVADICTTQYGYTASATDEAVGPRMLRVTDMNKEPWVEWADVPHCRIDDDLLPRYALKPGDVLVSRMADPGKAAIVEEVLPEGAVFASYLIRLATRSISASYYLFYYLRSDQYLDYAESVSGGTVQKNMNAQVITAAQMVIAPEAVADEFARLVRPWRAQIAANLQQTRQLAALRDALLPQLLSGEIRLRDAERAAGEALQSKSPPSSAARSAGRASGSVAAGAKGRE